VQKVGNEGVITVGKTSRLNEVDIVEGMKFTALPVAYFITNAER
jgi:hypothetical protein